MEIKLPLECWNEIFKQLPPKDLHSVVFINRELCTNAIPTLWQSPFASINENSKAKGKKLIDAYLECFSHEERDELARISTGRKPRAPSRNASIINNQPTHKPTFDYPSFLKSISAGDVCLAVSQWYHHTYQDPDFKKSQNRIQQVSMKFWNMIIPKTSGIRNLAYATFGRPVFFFASIFDRPDADVLFSNLKRLLLDPNKMTNESLRKACLICPNLETLSFTEVGQDDDLIAHLIVAQKSLRKLIITGKNNPIQTIFRAINTHRSTLVELDIQRVSFAGITFRMEFLQLRKFSLSCMGMHGLDMATMHCLENLNLPRLEYLDLHLDDISLNSIETLLKNTNESLIRLGLVFSSIGGVITAEDLYQIIGKNCPNLLSLSVGSRHDKVPALPTLFKHCHKLKTLSVSNLTMVTFAVTRLFSGFGFIVPTTLLNFNIMYYKVHFPSDALAGFLRNCNGRLSPKFKITLREGIDDLQTFVLGEWIERNNQTDLSSQN